MADAIHAMESAAGTVVNAAGHAIGAAGHATGTAATAVLSTAEATVENIADAASALTTNITETGKKAVHAVDRRLLKTTATLGRKYQNMVSPVVEGQGADFGDDDPTKKYVVLRMEICSSTDVKRMQLMSLIVTFFAVMATIALVVIKFKLNSQIKQHDNPYFTGSAIIAGILLITLLISGGFFLVRIIEARRTGKVWSRRRGYISTASFILVILQIINLILWLSGAAYAEHLECGWRDHTVALLGYFQWTCWNTEFLILVMLAHNGCLWHGKTNTADPAAALEQGTIVKESTALVLDAPVTVHTSKIVFWAAFQVFLSLVLWSLWPRMNVSMCEANVEEVCTPTTVSTVFLALMMVTIAIYVLAYAYYAWCTDRDIRSRPYAEMRFARMVFGLQHDQVLPVFAALGLCIILLAFVNIASCWTYVETWLGVIPLQAVGTCMAATLCFFFMPQRPGNKEQILQSWLQEFAWTTKGMPAALEERNHKLANSQSLASEPMFCVETAIKMLYFSNLVYNCAETKEEEADRAAGRNYEDTEEGEFKEAAAEKSPKSPTLNSVGINGALPEVEGVDVAAEYEETGPPLGSGDMEVALALYGLKDWEVIWERETDTKVLLAWGDNTLVVAFKGTSSLENVITDINFLKVNHPPTRFASTTGALGGKLIRLLVRVHKGFFKAWTDLEFDKRVLARVGEFLNGMSDPATTKVYITGHSLGGALATLGAHAMRKSFPQHPVCVYTYGQPRVGNRAFAYEYNHLVPEHFAVINDQDPVTRIPMGFYKRVGDRVIINEHGDIAVRPTYLEMQIINHAAAGEVGDHFLEFYRQAFMMIIHSQFTGRSLRNGKEGASALANEMNLDTSLMGLNLDLASLQNPAKHPVTDEEENRKLQSRKRKSRSIGCGGIGCGGGGGQRRRSDPHEHDHEVVVKLESKDDEIPPIPLVTA